CSETNVGARNIKGNSTGDSCGRRDWRHRQWFAGTLYVLLQSWCEFLVVNLRAAKVLQVLAETDEVRLNLGRPFGVGFRPLVLVRPTTLGEPHANSQGN